MKKFTFNYWLIGCLTIWLIGTIDLYTTQYLEPISRLLPMVAWVLIGIAILRPEELKRFIRGQQPDMSDEDVVLLSEAKKMTDNLVLSLKLELTNIEYAQLTQENLWKLRGEVEK